MMPLRYSVCLGSTLFCALGCVMGGTAVLVPLLYVLGGCVWFDTLGAPSAASPTRAGTGTYWVVLAALLHLAMLVLFLWTLGHGTLSGGWCFAAAVAVGMHSGLMGIVPAHELIHRRHRWLRALGVMALLPLGYAHFYVEHVHGHHRWVGTPRDPATARRGESLYAFILRTVPGQWKSAFRLEQEQQRKKGRRPAFNRILWFAGIQLAGFAGLWLWLGTLYTLCFLLQALVAIFLLEYVNYIEHYGLERQSGQKVEACHSWQTNTAFTRQALFELGRHADHHLRASRPFPQLESHAHAPELPGGYFRMFWVALVPGLWRKQVDPLLPKPIQNIKQTQ